MDLREIPERDLEKRSGWSERMADDSEELELQQALKDFRQSMRAWSDSMYNRPRTAAEVVRHRTWRLAASWALGCVLVAGSASGAMYERHHRQEMVRAAAAEQARAAAEQQQLLVEQRAHNDEEDLLAKVDSDVSREVPSAMEPLAQLMTEDGAQ